MAYNTAERKAVREAEKASRLADLARQEVVRTTMSTPAGRQYLWERLTAAHIFTAAYPTSALTMAFTEGERNQGLQLLADIMSAAPEAFILAMRESHVRDTAASARHDERPGERPDGPNGDWGAEGPGDTPDLFVQADLPSR